MQRSRTFSLVNASKCALELCMQRAVYSQWDLKGMLVSGAEPVLLMMSVRTASIAPYIDEVQENKRKQTLQLTVPVVPNERWFICCVKGPIMFAGCIDIGWSIVGVITAPYKHTQRPTENMFHNEGNFKKINTVAVLTSYVLTSH